MRIRRHAGSIRLAILALLLLGGARPVAAQTRSVATGAVETDSERLSVFLLGLSAHPTTPGFAPVVGLTAYRLSSSRGGVRTITKGVSPSAGVRYRYGPIAAQTSLGYLFLSAEPGDGFGAPLGAREGLVVSGLGEYMARTRSAVGEIAYNRADGFLWARGRATQRILGLENGGEVRVGVEGVGEAARDPVELPYRTLQSGGIVALRASPRVTLTTIVGAKADNIPGHPHYFPYFKFELSVTP